MFSVSKEKTRGFTLLELLIVIAIIAILSVILILVLNPAETLKKSRDVQRMSDLNTLKTAIGLILTSSSTPYLSAGNSTCLSGSGSTGVIYYSSNEADVNCAGSNPNEGTDTGATFAADPCKTGTTPTLVDGTGWLPVVFSWLLGGSPISNLPLDPINTTINTTPTNADLVYRYACQSSGATGKPSYVFELNAILESDAFKPSGDDDKSAKDGGDNAAYYEVGTSLRLIGTGTNF
ncbi:prepilin-type N-terminal cleavage/methylation domain-containing protein [Candidatus Falkowbacteria bacterium]|nr:prepilin-type N-terminal cleavage/methylation domain-containing protein [Candidatus Falkowbacteria bacterium]